MSNNKKAVIFFFLILIIIILVILNIFLPQINDLFTSKEVNTGEISVFPELIEEENNLYKVDIRFKTGDDVEIAKPISAITFSISYPIKEGITIESTELEPGPIIASKQWEIPINNIKYTENGVVFEFAAINKTPTGFTSSNFVTVASFYLKSEEKLDEDELVLSFNPEYTAIIAKEKPGEDIKDIEARLYFSVD